MKLKDLSLTQLTALARKTRKRFADRDLKWQDRRRIRFRQMDAELSSLPLSTLADKPLMIWQTEEPNQEVHRRTKRLVANYPRIETFVYDDSDKAKAAGQRIEDALRAIWRHFNRNILEPPDVLTTQYQQGDGLGVYKLDFNVAYAESLAPYTPDDLEKEPTPDMDPSQVEAINQYRDALQRYQDDPFAPAKAYRDVIAQQRKRLPLPFSLSAPDPLSIYWWEDHGRPRLVLEYGKKPLSPLLEALRDEGVRLVDSPDGPKLVLYEGSEVSGAATIPENAVTTDDDLVDYLELRTTEEIVIVLRSPHVRGRSIFNLREGDGVVLRYDNPFGPDSTGYVLVPGDITSSPDMADRYQPPVLGTINVAQPMNVLATIRLSAAIEAELRKPYVKTPDTATVPQLTTAETTKTSAETDGTPVPVIQGEVRLPEAPNIDLDKAEQRFAFVEAQNRFSEVLAGDATSADSGHKLAIQVSQADTQLVPYQNRRAHAIAEVLRCCEAAVAKLGVPVYIRDIPQSATGKERAARVCVLDPNDLVIDHEIMVTLGSETPITKFAKWAALSQRYREGGISFETWIEESDVENPSEEIARIFEGKALNEVMAAVLPVAIGMILNRINQKLAPAPEQSGMEAAAPAGSGAPAASSVPVAGIGKVPGVGLPEGGPYSREYGPPAEGGAGNVAGSTGGLTVA